MVTVAAAADRSPAPRSLVKGEVLALEVKYETDVNAGKRKSMGLVLKRRDNAGIVNVCALLASPRLDRKHVLLRTHPQTPTPSCRWDTNSCHPRATCSRTAGGRRACTCPRPRGTRRQGTLRRGTWPHKATGRCRTRQCLRSSTSATSR